MKFLFLLIQFFILCSCNTTTGAKNNNTVKSIKPNIKGKLTVDSFYIPLKKVLPTIKYSTFFNGRKYFVNSNTSSVDYIDFNIKKHVECFKLEEGLVNEMGAIGVASYDSIAFVTQKRIVVFDSTGKFLIEYIFNNKEAAKISIETSGFTSAIKASDGFIYERFDIRRSNHQYIGRYSFSKNKYIPVPVEFPQCEKGNVGLLNKFSYFYLSGKVYILFNPFPYIYVYDIKSNEIDQYSVKSEFDNGFQPFLGQDKVECSRHFVTSGNYTGMVYDPYKKEIIVTYLHPQNLKDSLGYFNQPYINRKGSIIILDEKLTKQREYELNTSLYALYLPVYPTRDGLVVKGLQPSHNLIQDEGLKYYLINFE